VEIKGFRWMGVACEDINAMTAFCGDVLGMKVLKKGAGGAFIEYELPSGQRFEVFGPRSRSYRLHSAPVLAFEVADIDSARRELKAAGIELLTRTNKRARDAYWFYFRAPDDFVYECQQWNI
jgi:catechol 2,3-dioxygenase-like lactoylglutathione lyase family enzyme